MSWEETKEQFRSLNECIVGSWADRRRHKIHCLSPGVTVNADGECLCERHKDIIDARTMWKGFIEGA